MNPRTYQEFLSICQPLKNPINPTENFNGVLFNITTEEIQYLNEQVEKGLFIATLTDDNDESLVQPGKHFVNRLGYFLLQHPLQEGFTL